MIYMILEPPPGSASAAAATASVAAASVAASVDAASAAAVVAASVAAVAAAVVSAGLEPHPISRPAAMAVHNNILIILFFIFVSSLNELYSFV